MMAAAKRVFFMVNPLHGCEMVAMLGILLETAALPVNEYIHDVWWGHPFYAFDAKKETAF